MEHAKKMILIDPKMMETRMSSPIPNTRVDSIHSLDREMRDILEKKYVNDEDKANDYHQVLRLYLKRVNQYNRGINDRLVSHEPNKRKEEDIEKRDLEKEVLESVLNNSKIKAEKIIQRIKPHLEWNDHGEIIVGDQTIRHSNLSDLVNDALRKRKDFDPVGWKEFASVLNKINVSRDLIGNQERWNFMRSLTQIIPSPPPSPQRSRRRRRPKIKGDYFDKNLTHWETL